MKNLRIGIDLDHTILDYSRLFHTLAVQYGWVERNCSFQKEELKRQLVIEAGSAFLGEHRWQNLQAMAYGEHIDEAVLFEGFQAFARHMKTKGYTLFIVSHKSTASHLEPSVHLREHALKTMKKRGFFKDIEEEGLGFSEDDIFFEDTQEDKLRAIAGLELTHFIDDLPAVLQHELFPGQTQPVLCGEAT